MALRIATLCRSLSLLLLFTSLARSQTCYVSPGVAAPDTVVPCGTGTAACCQLGDICLEDSACFNDAFGVTYLYGCSDSSYTDAVCPWKCGSDFANVDYVGLVYCSGVADNIWACTHPPSGDTVQANPASDQQTCSADSQVAFAAGNPLVPVLILPSTAGGSTEYFSEISPTSYTQVPGYTPDSIPTVVPSKPTAPEQVIAPSTTTTTTTTTRSTTPVRTTTSAKPTTTSAKPTTTSAKPTTTSARPTTTSAKPTTTSARPTTTSAQPSTTSSIVPTTTSSSSSSSTTSSVSPTTTSPTTTFSTSTHISSGSSSSTSIAPVPVSSKGLSTGAKAGIGGGVAGGVIALAALGLLFFCLRKRRRSHEPVPQNEVPYSPYSPEPKQQRYTDHAPGLPPVIGAGGWHEGRSELPGDVPNQRFSTMKPGSQSELDSYSRFESPAPTYSSWENSTSSQRQSGLMPVRPGHDTIHELPQQHLR